MNLIKLFQAGQRYMEICLTDKHLAYSFPEIKIIRVIKYMLKYLPIIIVTLCVWQYFMKTGLLNSVITAIFALSLPIQGILWLGKRANSPLPLNLLPWYLQTKHKLIEKGLLATKPDQKDNMDLMQFMLIYRLASRYLDEDS